MDIRLTRRSMLAALPLAMATPGIARAAALKGGTLRVAILADVNNYDPQSFITPNFPLIKNLYDSLIEYTPDGHAIPSLASAWAIAPDHQSVAVTLREGVAFQSGAPLDAAAVAATLKKAADPVRGKNLFSTMGPVRDWSVGDAHTITLNFKAPTPGRAITDLLQFISVIDPAGTDTVETKPAGSGAYMLAERVLGQRVRLVANARYWRAGEPVFAEIVLTVFSDNEAAGAALESGGVDLIYGGGSRTGVRLRNAGFQLIEGPGPLVQVLRLNATRGPFRNAKFRQAFNVLVDRQAVLKVGYAGLGQVTALPWAPASPAADPSYNQTYAFNLEKGQALLKECGLTPAEMSDWKLLVLGDDQDNAAICQVVQSDLGKVGIKVPLDLKQGSEYFGLMLAGTFDATFAAAGNVQKFPSRITTNSIYRTAKNPVLGDPNPFPAYVAAIERVNATVGSGAEARAAYDALNQALVQAAFGIPTNTYDIGLIVAAKNLGGVTLDIDNMLVARTMGFTG